MKLIDVEGQPTTSWRPGKRHSMIEIRTDQTCVETSEDLTIRTKVLSEDEKTQFGHTYTDELQPHPREM